MKRRTVVVVAVLLFFACDPLPHNVVTLLFDESGEHVTIVTNATIRTEEERAALLTDRDEWSVRFAQANPDADRLILDRTRGQITAVERRATIASDQLQRFFFDTPITVTTTRGDGWLELAIYPGASNRASQAQRREAEKLLDVYSARAVRYFNSVRSMYAYLEQHPQRAHELFTDVFSTSADEDRPLLSETERSLSDRVRESIDPLLDLNETADRLLDIAYNPFPAQVRVAIKGSPLAVEGFTRVESDKFEIHLPTAFEAVGALEGRWISPDPLALAYRSDTKSNAADLATQIERQERHFDPVVSQSEVAAAIVQAMRPAARYRLRWTTRPPAS
ncbi:MAG TPA: hypothetical protein VLU46_02920 [Thermoanaerobaculia bacterium]|nr:hypothetical protein [Thermoanaerobaculia bacterium]